MYGDEYLYQELGYRNIYSRLKDVTEGDIVKRFVYISNIPVDPVTQEDWDEYKHFRKTNCAKLYILTNGLARTIYIGAYVLLLLLSAYIMRRFIQERNIAGIFVLGCSVIVYSGIWARTLIPEWKELFVKPLGVTRGYLVNTHIQSTTKRSLFKPYKKITVYSQSSVVWIEKKDMFLRNVNHSLVRFDYAGKEYAWSELVYTPVKIFVLQDE